LVARPVSAERISKQPYVGAIVIDQDQGQVLFEDQPDAVGYPASMLKLVTMYVTLDNIQKGAIKLDDMVKVTAEASRMGGSQVYLAENEVFSVEELLYALMVQSANDAAVALAVYQAGTKEAFVELMNQKAQELGMNDTTFTSVHGLPPGRGQQPDRTTARDFAKLSRALIKAHPEALQYTSTDVREFRPTKPFIMRNHNPLLKDFEGCDGLKTGYYRDAGFSIAATAERNGVRVIAVVMGSRNKKERNAKARELLATGLLKAPRPEPKPEPKPVVKPAEEPEPVETIVAEEEVVEEETPRKDGGSWGLIALIVIIPAVIGGIIALRRSKPRRRLR
jgi:D-alanyl-D-alanine carboxypeptidase (penicillin-binding protein 5/6)